MYRRKFTKKIIQHTLPQVAVMVTCNQAFFGGWGGGGGRVAGKRKKRTPLASERRGEGLPPDHRLLAWIT